MSEAILGGTNVSASPVDNGAGAAAPAAPSTPATWRDSLPAELKGDASLAKFTDINALAGSYVSLQKMVGADKIPVPGKNAGEQEWQNVYKKLGMPESADKYELKAAEGADPAFLQGFKELAMKNGVLPKQAQGLMDWYNGQMAEAQKQQAERKQADTAKGIEALKSEWGEGWDKNVAAAKAAVDAFGDDGLKEYLAKTGLGNDPVIIKLMAKIGSTLKEDGIKGQGSNTFGLTPQEAQEKINSIMSNPQHPYFVDTHMDHKRAVDEMSKLFQARHRSA